MTLYEAIRLQLLLYGVPAQNLAITRGSQAFSLAITAGNAVGVMPDSSEIIANHLLICRPVAEYRSGFEIMLAWPRFSTSPALAQVYNPFVINRIICAGMGICSQPSFLL